MSQREKKLEAALRGLFDAVTAGSKWEFHAAVEHARAALSTPAPEGGDRCPTCLQMPDAYQKGIEDGARGQYRRGVEDAARICESRGSTLYGAMIRALAPPATEGATKEEP